MTHLLSAHTSHHSSSHHHHHQLHHHHHHHHQLSQSGGLLLQPRSQQQHHTNNGYSVQYNVSHRSHSQSQDSSPPPLPPVAPHGHGRTYVLTNGTAALTNNHIISNNSNNNNSQESMGSEMLLACTPSTSQQSLYSMSGGTGSQESGSTSSMDKSLFYEHEYQNLNESLMLENRRLKAEVELLKRRCSKYERVESEIVKVCQAHEDLMASSERKEQLEKAVRLKLEAEIVRLNGENRELRIIAASSVSIGTAAAAGGSGAMSAIASSANPGAAVTTTASTTTTTTAAAGLVPAVAMTAATLAEYELQAQRATLEEQRFHIQILDGALVQAQAKIQRLESELQQQERGGTSPSQMSPASVANAAAAAAAACTTVGLNRGQQQAYQTPGHQQQHRQQSPQATPVKSVLVTTSTPIVSKLTVSTTAVL